MNVPKKYIDTIEEYIPKRYIGKDLILSYLLQELCKIPELIFKGGTCLSKCYLNYHRFSEDLDFNLILPEFQNKTQKKYDIRNYFKNTFLPKLQETCDFYAIDFKSTEFVTQETRYTPVKRGDNIYTFYIYNNQDRIKIEINVSEKHELPTKKLKINNYANQHLTYPLNENKISCLAIEEICAEKIRAILTRPQGIQERDIYDLYIIHKNHNVLGIDDKLIQKKLTYNIFPIKNKNIDQYKLFQEIEYLTQKEIHKKEYTLFWEELKKKIKPYTNL